MNGQQRLITQTHTKVLRSFSRLNWTVLDGKPSIDMLPPEHFAVILTMDVDHGRGWGTSPPRIWTGDAKEKWSPQDFVIQAQKGAFCGLQNTPKSVSGRGSAPDHTWGAHDATLDSLDGWRGDVPLHIKPHSAPINLRCSPCYPKPPSRLERGCPSPYQNSSEIYASDLLSSTLNQFTSVPNCT